jgi:hypothetical protein
LKDAGYKGSIWFLPDLSALWTTEACDLPTRQEKQFMTTWFRDSTQAGQKIFGVLSSSFPVNTNTTQVKATIPGMFRTRALIFQCTALVSVFSGKTSAFVARSGLRPVAAAVEGTWTLQSPYSLPSPTARRLLLSRLYYRKAKDFFASPEFYDGSEEVAALYAKKREEKFGDASAWSVLSQFKTEVQVKDYFKSTGIYPCAVLEYVHVKQIEDALHDQEIVALNAESEIDLIHQRYVRVYLPDPLHDVDSRIHASMSLPFFWVFGATGIGKTFYAVKQAAKFDMDKLLQTKYVTFYLKPFDLKFFKKNKDMGELAGWIKASIVEKYGRFDKLAMHVSVVLDDACSPCGSFESARELRSLLYELEKFTNKVRLVIVGARVHRVYWRREGEATYLGPWCQQRLQTLAASQFQIDKNAVDSILGKPVLKALTTDARSAWLLFQAVRDNCPVDNVDEMSCSVPLLSVSVIESYIEATGLKQLSEAARRRVAAWVLYKVEDAKTRFNRSMVEFEGLPNEKEVNVAFSLISLNCRYYVVVVSHADDWREEASASFVDGKKQAVEISGAMEFALMSVLFGASNAVASYDNDSAEEGTSWADLRAPVTAAVERFLEEFSTSPDRAHKQLDKHLKDCRRRMSPPTKNQPKAPKEAAEP